MDGLSFQVVQSLLSAGVGRWYGNGGFLLDMTEEDANAQAVELSETTGRYVSIDKYEMQLLNLTITLASFARAHHQKFQLADTGSATGHTSSSYGRFAIPSLPEIDETLRAFLQIGPFVVKGKRSTNTDGVRRAVVRYCDPRDQAQEFLLLLEGDYLCLTTFKDVLAQRDFSRFMGYLSTQGAITQPTTPQAPLETVDWLAFGVRLSRTVMVGGKPVEELVPVKWAKASYVSDAFTGSIPMRKLIAFLTNDQCVNYADINRFHFHRYPQVMELFPDRTVETPPSSPSQESKPSTSTPSPEKDTTRGTSGQTAAAVPTVPEKRKRDESEGGTDKQGHEVGNKDAQDPAEKRVRHM
ncbi:hypothetical protein HDU93_002139 [Gonapodya sp. JEL0774]|nr:hypothetical protein HDU93_002139 [Gonapodya sp. JEL0774]